MPHSSLRSRDVHLLHFFMLIVMRWFQFAISNWFWWKNCQENGQFSYFSLFHVFWKSLNLFCKYLCDEFSKIKNLRCRLTSFFHADRHEMIFICHILHFLVENWPRKWSFFLFFIISRFSKISQHVLQISLWWSFKI